MSIQVTNKFRYLNHHDFCLTVSPKDDGSSSTVLIIGLAVILGIVFIIIALIFIVLCACVYMKKSNTDGPDTKSNTYKLNR